MKTLTTTILAGLAGICAVAQASDPSATSGAYQVAAIDAPRSMVEFALADAGRRAQVDPSALTVVSAEALTWSDGSLGCPRPGMMYTQALVPGYLIRVEAGGRTLEYHQGGDGVPFLCPSPLVLPEPAGQG